MHASANSNRCGRCKAVHGGTNHTCPVHGNVSKGCCEKPCDPKEWLWVDGVGPVANLTLARPGEPE